MSEEKIEMISANETTGQILTVDAGDLIDTNASLEDARWHDVQNAYFSRRILSGILGGIEETENRKTIAVVVYQGFRVAIPLKEMFVDFPKDLSGRDYTDAVKRYGKLLSKMLGAEIDFVIMGIDSGARSIVASRRTAMLNKRQQFYLTPNEEGQCRVNAGQVLQARVIGVSEYSIRIEAFGVEASIGLRDLSYSWISDAADYYAVGQRILVRVLEVNREPIDSISIRADVKSVSDRQSSNLHLCRVQSRYAGTVTDVRKGIVFLRLSNGVNAIAHTCYDRRTPGRKDSVSFVVTGLNEEHQVAVGIITRIIKQNL